MDKQRLIKMLEGLPGQQNPPPISSNLSAYTIMPATKPAQGGAVSEKVVDNQEVTPTNLQSIKQKIMQQLPVFMSNYKAENPSKDAFQLNKLLLEYFIKSEITEKKEGAIQDQTPTEFGQKRGLAISFKEARPPVFQSEYAALHHVEIEQEEKSNLNLTANKKDVTVSGTIC